MHFISVAAVNEKLARDIIVSEFGFMPSSIGEVLLTSAEIENSRQKTFVFGTSNDITQHPKYAKALLSDKFDLAAFTSVEDGPIIEHGPEVTVGG